MADSEQIVRDVAERVRQLVTEAEERAAEIVRDAEADAQRIRERAEAEARERLAEVRSALDELQGRLGATPTSEDSGTAAASRTAAETEPEPTPAPEPPSVPEPAPEPEPPAVPEPTPDPVPNPIPGPEPVPEPEPPIVPEPTPPPDEGTPPQAANGSRSDDEAAARLVAMNLALEGASREDAKARLGTEYDLPDLDALVDEVYSRAGR